MRGGETERLESTLNTATAVQWQDLSDLEQARMGLAIARYALAELEQNS
jgi:hypothetical protein